MGGYIFRKLASAFVTLFAIALCTFLMGRAVPGGPFDSEKVLPEHIKKLQEEKYGYDKPPIVHFFHYMEGLIFHADLGKSVKFVDRSVGAIILETLPVTFSLGGLAIVFAIVVGFPLGILSATKPNSVWDTGAMFIAVSGVTLPTFLIGAVLVLFFSQTLGWLPPARLDQGFASYILPMITLGARPAAIVARVIRASLLDQLKMDYVRTARAKGVKESDIVLKHMLRNSLIPLVSIMGPVTANILTGSFIVEHFFAISGMAKHFINAVNNRDVFLMIGVTLVFASILIAVNLIVDLLYPLLDPRMASA